WIRCKEEALYCEGGEALDQVAQRNYDALDETTRKDLFTDTLCKVCGAVLQFESQRASHYKGKKHAQKVRLYIQMRGKKDERQEDGKQRKTDCTNFQVTIPLHLVDKNKYCNLCNMFFTSPVVALSHYLGKIHAKKLKQLSVDQAHMPAQSSFFSAVGVGYYMCPICNVTLTSIETYQSHVQGNKHQINVTVCPIPYPLSGPSIKSTSLQFRDKDVVRDSAKSFAQVQVADVHCSSLIHQRCHPVRGGHQICQARFALSEAMLAVTSHLLIFHVETVLVNLMKKSKKTYDSFQDELMDYSKVQKARGIEQRRYLGKAEEEEFQDKNIEGGSDLGKVISSNFQCEQGQHSSRSPTNTGKNRSPSWPSACEHALEKTPNCHYNKGCCKEEQGSEVATIRERSFSLLVAESKDCYKLRLAETSTSSYRKEQKFQIKHFEEEKCISEELKFEKEATKQKRKENSEGADFGKENEKQKRIKFEVDLVNEKKSIPYKNKRLKENPAEKESKKHKKGKKKPQTDNKEEELLWDESVLGC
uniref:Zinc finger matrin-type 1 n=1 Tax=Aquila chrysaetos chrysaetos TaxID=223781 RepID=A0A663DJS2_AQUCH